MEFAQVVAAARAAYPALRATDEQLAAHLAGRDLAVRCAPDLVLAAAGLAGDPGAVREIDRLLEDVAPALRGVVIDHERADLVQSLRARLFVGDAAKPAALAAYAGAGPLRAWMRVALVRSGLDRRRRPSAAPLDEAAWLALPADTADPGIAALHRTAAPAVRAALETALASLEPRERLLLRQHLLDGLAPPELASLHGVHRVTAFRWIAQIRARILALVRAELGPALGLTPSALDSLMRSLRASAAPTISRVLVEGEE